MTIREKVRAIRSSDKLTKDRCRDAWRRLADVGFSFDADYKFGWLKAAASFNSATLWQVFALGQILEREQPITVRGAFYRAVSAGIYPDTADDHYRACKTRILDMRRFGLVPYNYISDSTRRRLKPSSGVGLQTSPKLSHKPIAKTSGSGNRGI